MSTTPSVAPRQGPNLRALLELMSVVCAIDTVLSVEACRLNTQAASPFRPPRRPLL